MSSSSNSFAPSPGPHPCGARSNIESDEAPTVLSIPSPPDKPLQISKIQFENARRQLISQPSGDPITLSQGISLKEYCRYCENNEGGIPLRIRLINGDVVAYEAFLFPHSIVVGRFFRYFSYWDANDDLSIESSLDMEVGENSMLTCDFCIRPWRLPSPPQEQGANRIDKAYPTVVIEVATIQSLSDVNAMVAHWFSPRTTIQLCLIIKIWNPNQDGTIAMVALLYRRANTNPLIPTNATSFGTTDIDWQERQVLEGIVGSSNFVTGVGYDGAPCNGPGIPMYQMNLPATDIYNGDPQGIPAAKALGLDLDLWDIQQKARYGYNLQ